MGVVAASASADVVAESATDVLAGAGVEVAAVVSSLETTAVLGSSESLLEQPAAATLTRPSTQNEIERPTFI